MTDNIKLYAPLALLAVGTCFPVAQIVSISLPVWQVVATVATGAIAGVVASFLLLSGTHRFLKAYCYQAQYFEMGGTDSQNKMNRNVLGAITAALGLLLPIVAKTAALQRLLGATSLLAHGACNGFWLGLAGTTAVSFMLLPRNSK